MPTAMRAANGEPSDITVVGAGMAGHFSAWRLLSWRLLSPAAQHTPPIQQLIQVLCMPRHALELLDPDADGAHAIFQLPVRGR